MTQSSAAVRIDRGRCTGSGVCAYHAPETFDVGDDGKSYLLGGTDPTDAIRAAVSACPSRALSFTDTPEPRP